VLSGSWRGQKGLTSRTPSHLSVPMRTHARLSSALALGAALFGWSSLAQARVGTHAPAVSTFDTRASSVVLQGTYGSFSGGGHLMFASYNANFTSTSGALNAQFGAHYANLLEDGAAFAMHGVAGSGVALYNVAMTDRHDNGLAYAATALYTGMVPTVMSNGSLSYVTIPLVVGAGLPISPASFLTITPWAEVSPSLNVDAFVDSQKLTTEVTNLANETVNQVATTTANAAVSQVTSGIISQDQANEVNAALQQSLQPERLNQALNNAVQTDIGMQVGWRAGMNIAVHLGESFDLNLSGLAWRMGAGAIGAKESQSVLALNTGLVWRWDDIVPAVLPPSRRLSQEACDDVESRFKQCPAYFKLEQSLRPVEEPAPVEGPAEPPAAAPAPAVDVPAPAAPEAPAAPTMPATP
jgi:hypothetical protein